jgi:hypothetical protein
MARMVNLTCGGYGTHQPQRWYWRIHYTRISRGLFYALGGFSNPDLHRRGTRSGWSYWKRAT